MTKVFSQMIWDALCEQYLSALDSPRFPEAARQLMPKVLKAASAIAQEDIDWFERALNDERRKWFVPFVLESTPDFPQALFMPMIHAAVYERNPSANRFFVEPCIGAFGHRRVKEALLGLVRSGSNSEKAGAVNALYWAEVEVVYMGLTNLEKGVATPESRAAHDALIDIWLAKRCLLLQEFVSNTDVDVRRSIVASLELDPGAYPDKLKPLVDQAIQIALAHPDEYIGHRIGVNLGTERLLKPLPHRD
ncbi:MAG TPA: hypothetical protein VJ733_10565 [Candidatus Binatia bacterium]|nr:hypothetical protein [Candidatus Binatia bacterium]